MRHIVLTRSAYVPELWPLEANRRRLALLRAVTARSLARQTSRAWRWAVMLHERDPLRRERAAVVRDACPRAVILYDRGAATTRDGLALRAYEGWRGPLQSHQGRLLTTRVDDDDAFASDALARVRAAAERTPVGARTALVIPNGYRVWQGRASLVRHETNAWSSVLSPDGDPFVVFDVRHRQVREAAPLRFVDERPGWLWVRHPDTLSGEKAAASPIGPALRALFPIDWAALGEPARGSGPSGEVLYR